jgi:type II secretory pathway pseudopilin PulG
MSRSNLVTNRCLRRRGYMFAMMLAVLALMGIMGVVVGRLLLNVKHNNTVQLQQQNKQYLNRTILSLAKQSSDANGDDLTEPPQMDPSTLTGFTPPANGGGWVPNKASATGKGVASTDVYGRRLGYCAYRYNSSSATGWITSPTSISADSTVVALVVISAGKDGLFSTSCPASSSSAASIAPTGDDQLAAYSQNQMVEFAKAAGFADIATLGSQNSGTTLCRLDRSNKFVCDTPAPSANCSATQQLSASVNSSGVPTFSCKTFAPSDSCPINSLATWNGSTIICKTFAPSSTCSPTQVSSWNGYQFDCKDLPKGLKGDTGDTGDTANCNALPCVDSVGSHPVNGPSWYNPDTCSWYTCTNGTITLNPGNDGVCNNCLVGDVTYPHLFTWDEGPTICKKASCNDGTVTYGAAITTGSCAPVPPPPTTCSYGGKTYNDSDTWSDTSPPCRSYKCNNGVTQDVGASTSGSCAPVPPPPTTCSYGGNTYNEGQSWYNTSNCTNYTCWTGVAVPWIANGNKDNLVCDVCYDGQVPAQPHGQGGTWYDVNSCETFTCNDGTFESNGATCGGNASCGSHPHGDIWHADFPTCKTYTCNNGTISDSPYTGGSCSGGGTSCTDSTGTHQNNDTWYVDCGNSYEPSIMGGFGQEFFAGRIEYKCNLGVRQIKDSSNCRPKQAVGLGYDQNMANAWVTSYDQNSGLPGGLYCGISGYGCNIYNHNGTSCTADRDGAGIGCCFRDCRDNGNAKNGGQGWKGCPNANTQAYGGTPGC